MRTPRIRNGYLQFGGKIKRRKTKRRIDTKRGRQKRGAFFGSMLASTITPVSTNLLNDIVGKIF